MTKTAASSATDGRRAAARARVVEKLKEARRGNFLAFLDLCGYARDSSSSKPIKLDLAQAHIDMALEMSDHMRCRNCGKYHYQETDYMVPSADVKSRDKDDEGDEYRVVAVTCPHCGMRDCAGRRLVGEEACKGLGKTEIALHAVAFYIGLAIFRGKSPIWMMVGANDDEAKEKLSLLLSIMQRPQFTTIFGDGADVTCRQSAKQIKLTKTGRIVATSHGIMGVPPGHHVDGIMIDDVVNINSSFMKPKLIPQVANKVAQVLDSVKPWSVVLYLTNALREGDATSKLRKTASRSSKRWIWARRPSGGPPNFESPWPKGLPPSMLRDRHTQNERSYQRGYMLLEIADDEVAFKNISYWVMSSDVPPEIDHPEAYCRVVGGTPRELGWPTVVACDPGFSGVEGDTKNRSHSGFVVGGRNPKDGSIYVWESHLQMLPPNKLRPTLKQLCLDYATMVMGLESGAAQKDYVDSFVQDGYEVYPYFPAEMGGNKAMRKFTLASDVNDGVVLLRGKFVKSDKGEWEVEAHHNQTKLNDSMTLYPTEVRDDLDALEILRNTIFKVYGPASRTEIADERVKTELSSEAQWIMETGREKPPETRSLNRMFEDDYSPGVGNRIPGY